jgi:hypothetical protein
VEGAPGPDDLSPATADEGQLAVDDEAPMGVGARSLERRPGGSAGLRLDEDVRHRVEDDESDVEAALAERPKVARRDVQRAGLRNVACR